MNRRTVLLIILWLAILAGFMATLYFRQSIPWNYLFRLAITFVFFGVIIKMQFQVREIVQRMSREQQQDLLSRAAAIMEIKRATESLARRTEMIAESVKEDAEVSAAKVAQVTNDLRVAIAENTEISKQAADTAVKAYEEANSINTKIARLGLEHNALQEEQKAQDVEDRAQADSIQETGEDSNRMLKDEKP